MPAADGQSRFCAIFGDVIRSRKIAERSDLQKRLLVSLDMVNTRFSSQLVAPFRFVAGDEIRGLLQDESESYAVIRVLQSCVYPYEMRFAVGIGGISTERSSDIAELDGPALHRASSAMLFLKNRKRSHGRTIYYCSANIDRDEMLNALMFLVSSIRSSWTETMQEKIKLLSSGLTLMEVGGRLGVSHQAVRKSIVQANYYALVEGEALIGSLLRDCSLAGLQCLIATSQGCGRPFEISDIRLGKEMTSRMGNIVLRLSRLDSELWTYSLVALLVAHIVADFAVRSEFLRS